MDFVTVSRTGTCSSRGLLCVCVCVCVNEYLCLCFVCVGEGEREAPRADGVALGEGELDDISRAHE